MDKKGAINLKKPWLVILILVVLAVIIYFYNSPTQEITGNAAVVIVDGTTTVFVEYFDIEEGDIVPENLNGVGGGHRATPSHTGISNGATYLSDKNYLIYDMASMHLSNKKISDVSKVSFYLKPKFRMDESYLSAEHTFLALGDVGNAYNNLELYSNLGVVTLEINDKTGKRLTCPVNVYNDLVTDEWYIIKLEIQDDFASVTVEDYLTKDIINFGSCDVSDSGEEVFSTFEFDSFDKIWIGVDSRRNNGAASIMDELKIYFN